MAETASFEQLIERHQPEIYIYILRMVGHDGEAQDLCQETFLRAYRAFSSLDGDSNYRAWLYKIAGNTTLNHIRQRRTGQRALTTLSQTLTGVQDDDHLDRVGQSELLARVECAIQSLPTKQRIAFLQRKFVGLTYGEIAENLQCSEDSARAHVYQAVRKLRRQFSGELSEVGL